MTPRVLLIVAGVSGAVAVALGAFGAHALAEAVPPERLETWRTASVYHLVHTLALGLAGVMGRLGWRTGAARGLFLVGIVLFCGSLYALVLLDQPLLGAVAPVGGVAFIAGWAALAVASWRERPDDAP
ncbi:MAG: DUF423 domain-containing protein [Bacteroidota bacterium]